MFSSTHRHTHPLSFRWQSVGLLSFPFGFGFFLGYIASPQYSKKKDIISTCAIIQSSSRNPPVPLLPSLSLLSPFGRHPLTNAPLSARLDSHRAIMFSGPLFLTLFSSLIIFFFCQDIIAPFSICSLQVRRLILHLSVNEGHHTHVCVCVCEGEEREVLLTKNVIH